MPAPVAVEPDGRHLAGPGWRLRAEWARPGGTFWNSHAQQHALAGVRRGLTLELGWSDGDPELDVAAWAGEPDTSDGIAVLGHEGEPVALAVVPLCGCGERGCGNVNVQYAARIGPAELPELIALLRALPWSETTPDSGSVLRGGSLGAIPGHG